MALKALGRLWRRVRGKGAGPRYSERGRAILEEAEHRMSQWDGSITERQEFAAWWEDALEDLIPEERQALRAYATQRSKHEAARAQRLMQRTKAHQDLSEVRRDLDEARVLREVAHHYREGDSWPELLERLPPDLKCEVQEWPSDVLMRVAVEELLRQAGGRC